MSVMPHRHKIQLHHQCRSTVLLPIWSLCSTHSQAVGCCSYALCCWTDADNDTEAENIFDNIEYRKGGSLLRMLWNYMSSDYYKSSRLPDGFQTAHSHDVRAIQQFVFW